jgi:hypothetical protein
MAAKLREGASTYYQPWLASEELAHLIEELRFVFIGLGRMRYFGLPHRISAEYRRNPPKQAIDFTA